jgi:hypothetical protein
MGNDANQTEKVTIFRPILKNNGNLTNSSVQYSSLPMAVIFVTCIIPSNGRNARRTRI